LVRLLRLPVRKRSPILTAPEPRRGGGNERERRAGVEGREWEKRGEEEEGTERETAPITQIPGSAPADQAGYWSVYEQD